MKKQHVQGLKIGLLSKVRKAILIIEDEFYGEKAYVVEGRETATYVCDSLERAKVFAREGRLRLARSLFNKKEKQAKRKVINL